MKINKSNYEIYFLDYHDRNLSAEQQAELFLFIEQHPELKNEFENFEMINLPSIEAEFPDKNSLKKELITKDNYKHFLIAELEGDLSRDEQKMLSNFLFEHPELRKEEKLFSYTKLTPDKKIVFPGKLKLKQPIPIAERSNKVLYFSIAAAASIVFLIGIYFFNRDKSNDTLQAGNQTKKEIVPVVQNENKSTNALNVAEQKEQPKPDKPVLVQNPVKQQNAVKESKQDQFAANNHTENKNISSRPDEIIETISKKELTQLQAKETMLPQITFIDPVLVKEKMIRQLAKDPSSYNAKDFDAYLDKLANPDSTFTSEDMNKPVFASSAPGKQTETPILDALAWGISKVANKDITLNKNYNREGELVAYQFESGKLKFGKGQGK